MLQRTHSSISTSFILSAETGERIEVRWRSVEVKEKHTCCWQNCRVKCECLWNVLSLLLLSSLPLFCVWFFFLPPRVLLDGAKKLPRPPELCVAHQVRPSERTLMCDFPSTCRPKWIGTNAIIFCHYSFWARHCAEIQTILAVWSKKKKNTQKTGREREREWNLCDCDSSKDSWASLVKRQR